MTQEVSVFHDLTARENLEFFGGIYFSSKGLGIDNLGFRYADVKVKLEGAFGILITYEESAVEKPDWFGQPLRSMGFQWVSSAGQLGGARTPWIFETLA